MTPPTASARRPPPGLSALTGNVMLSALLIALLTWLCTQRPVFYAYLISEDQGVEYATFVAATVAAVLFGAAMVRQRGASRAGYALLALASFALGMEEISWGQRVLGIATPAFFAERNAQYEITFHNFFESRPRYREGAYLILAMVVGLWLAAWRLPAVARFCQRLGVPLVRPYLWPFFALVVYSQDWRFWWRPLVDADELTEFFACLALAVWSLDIVRRSRAPVQVTSALSNAALLVLIAVATIPFVVLFPDREILPVEINRLAGRDYPRRRLYHQAVEIFEHTRRHPELATDGGRLRHGLLLKYLGNLTEAERILGEAVDRRRPALSEAPDDPGVRLDLAESLFALGRDAEARDAIEQARQVARQALQRAADGDARASAHGWLGVAMLMAGDSAASQASFAAARAATATQPARRRLDARIQTFEARFADLYSKPEAWH